MPRPFSNDFHWWIVWLNVILKIPASDIARVLNISKRIVYRYAGCFCIMGDVRPMKKNGPGFLLCKFEELYLIQLVLSNPGIYFKGLHH